MKKLLIVIDAQNDFITGALRNEEAIKTLPNLIKLIEEHNGTIIATRDTHYIDTNEEHIGYNDSLEGKLLPVQHCITNTNGWQIEENVLKVLNSKNEGWQQKFHIINKKSFGYDHWREELKFYNFDEIVIAGYCTDICVVSNTLILRALYPNIPITVVSNACAGVTPEKHNAALETMRSCQINII